jgi:hypothetical protein
MYKNKNLIYVNGKGYREQDLMDMIQFYQDNYNPNIVLPSRWNADVSAQVFKNYPFYSTISKSTYNPQVFYEQTCHLEISKKEYFNYIKDVKPEEFVLLGIRNDIDITVAKLAYIQKEGNDYLFLETIIRPEGMDTYQDRKETYEELIQLIIDEYHLYDQMLYDLISVSDIYDRRLQCRNFNNNYSKQMIKQYVNQILDIPTIININTFIINYSYYFFILYHILIYEVDVDKKRLIDDQIINFVELIDLGIPDDTNELKMLMDPYDIKNILHINDVTSQVEFTLAI